MSPPPIAVAAVVPRTEAEGPGARFALWVQGCPLRCKGCCNPDFLDPRGPATPVPPGEMLARVLAEEVEGLSLLGGEPTAQAAALAPLAAGVRAAGRTVMLYTGFALEALRARRDPDLDALLAACDLVVDGPYVEARRTTTRRWIGSDNQRLHFLTDAYRPDDPRFAARNTVEFHVSADRIVVNGFPVTGADGAALLECR